MARQTEELRNLGDQELVDRLAETRQELFNLRFRHVTSQLDDSARLGLLRRQVARLNTLLREREIAAAEAAAKDERAAVAVGTEETDGERDG